MLSWQHASAHSGGLRRTAGVIGSAGLCRAQLTPATLRGSLPGAMSVPVALNTTLSAQRPSSALNTPLNAHISAAVPQIDDRLLHSAHTLAQACDDLSDTSDAVTRSQLQRAVVSFMHSALVAGRGRLATELLEHIHRSGTAATCDSLLQASCLQEYVAAASRATLSLSGLNTEFLDHVAAIALEAPETRVTPAFVHAYASVLGASVEFRAVFGSAATFCLLMQELGLNGFTPYLHALHTSHGAEGVQEFVAFILRAQAPAQAHEPDVSAAEAGGSAPKPLARLGEESAPRNRLPASHYDDQLQCKYEAAHAILATLSELGHHAISDFFPHVLRAAAMVPVASTAEGPSGEAAATSETGSAVKVQHNPEVTVSAAGQGLVASHAANPAALDSELPAPVLSGSTDYAAQRRAYETYVLALRHQDRIEDAAAALTEAWRGDRLALPNALQLVLKRAAQKAIALQPLTQARPSSEALAVTTDGQVPGASWSAAEARYRDQVRVVLALLRLGIIQDLPLQPRIIMRVRTQ